MTQTSQVSGTRWSAGAVAGAIVWVLITTAVACWLFMIAFWEGVEIFSAPNREQVRAAWLMALGSGAALAAGPFGIWWFSRRSLWLALSGVGLAIPLVALAVYV
jgi:hypothetical protein